jgi:hypothetical protein
MPDKDSPTPETQDYVSRLHAADVRLVAVWASKNSGNHLVKESAERLLNDPAGIHNERCPSSATPLPRTQDYVQRLPEPSSTTPLGEALTWLTILCGRHIGHRMGWNGRCVHCGVILDWDGKW